MGYKPNIAVHPGRVIARALEKEEMTQKSLSARTGLTEKHLSQVINGEASVTVETALRLENALGGSASFWINLEKNYQETKARIERRALSKKEASLLSRFPYNELKKRGCVEDTRKKEERVENLWKFFGVNSLEFVSTIEPVAYRKRERASIKTGSIAAWLRCGELESRNIEVNDFSQSKLKKALPTLRKLTFADNKDFSLKAREVMAESGVRLVYVPHFASTGVNGACRWIGTNPVVQLSLLGAYADFFWFTLFHEIGHLLLHGKKNKFIEFKDQKLAMDREKEDEADAFARDALIPPKEFEIFINFGDFSAKSVASFAKNVGIDPGIVEGRLCREKISHEVSWEKQLGFRTKLKFVD